MSTQKPVGEVVNIEYNGVNYGSSVVMYSECPAGTKLYTHQAIPEGYKLVPIEPTNEMLIAAQSTWTSGINYSGAHIARYKAMLAAAPEIN